MRKERLLLWAITLLRLDKILLLLFKFVPNDLERVYIKGHIMNAWKSGFSALLDPSTGKAVIVIVSHRNSGELHDAVMTSWAKIQNPAWVESSEGDILDL